MIKATNLWKSFGTLTILKGLNLEVEAGETLVILGRSGVGKSVLLKLIMGLESPDQGSIEIDGVDIFQHQALTGQRNKRSVGMLFQSGALFDSMNVEENTAFYLKQHHPEMKASEIEDRVAQALALVGLKDTQHKMPSELSGGMRKRAALARLIVYRPKILLYDEPTTGLDPNTAKMISDLINQIKKELAATSIVVTHDMRSALDVGTKFAFHDEGQIAYCAEKSAFFSSDSPKLQEFFSNATVELTRKKVS